MLGNCERCGASSTSMPEGGTTPSARIAEKKAQAEKERNSQKYKWTVHCRESQARLVKDAADAQRLGLSYGNYMAAIHDGRIKRA